MRQFNDTVRQIYAATPSRAAGTPSRGPPHGSGRPECRCGSPTAAPYAVAEVFDYLGNRAVAGIEEFTGERGARVYRRTLRLPHGTGIAEVGESPGDGWLECRLHLSDPRDLTTATQRMRRLFDLDADPYAVDERLAADAGARPAGLPAPRTARPGRRGSA